MQSIPKPTHPPNLADLSLDAWWDLILDIRAAVWQSEIETLAYWYDVQNTTWVRTQGSDTQMVLIQMGDTQTGSEGLLYMQSQAPFQLHLACEEVVAEEVLAFLRLYVPYALQPYWARKQKKALAITHFAQTLDGRIASSSGDSKWIGNEGNLIHAHRMRALCDGILLGMTTLERDNPRLNVRLVKGESPTPVILGEPIDGFATYYAVREETYLVCEKEANAQPCQHLAIPMDGDVINTSALLEMLYQKGIYSVYVEGGSFTTSTFLQQGSIAQAQVHISPIILGSGVTGFSFPGVTKMEDVIQFKSGRFVPVGDHVMYLGEL